MQEKITFTITDLNDYELTLTQLCTLFEKILCFYSEKNVHQFEHLVKSFTVYFTMMYNLILESYKEGEQNEQ